MIRPQILIPFVLIASTQLPAPARAQTPPAPQMGATAPNPSAHSDAWVTTRMLAPGELVRAENVQIQTLDYPMLSQFSIDRSPVGLEAKHRVLAGRPLMERDVGRHALVRANAQVHITWQAAGISMQMEGRALQEGAAGDQIRVLNTASSRTLQGTVLADGTIQVGESQ